MQYLQDDIMWVIIHNIQIDNSRRSCEKCTLTI